MQLLFDIISNQGQNYNYNDLVDLNDTQLYQLSTDISIKGEIKIIDGKKENKIKGDIGYWIEELCLKSIPDIIAGRSIHIYYPEGTHYINVSSVNNHVRIYSLLMPMQFYPKEDFICALINLAKSYLKLVGKLSNYSEFYKKRIIYLSLYMNQILYLKEQINSKVNVTFFISFDNKHYYSEKDMILDNQAFYSQIKQANDLEGMIEISYGDQKIQIRDILTPWIQNFCLDSVSDLLWGGQKELLYFSYQRKLYLDSLTKQRKLIIQEEQNSPIIFPLRECLIALLECGKRYIHIISQFAELETRLLNEINYLISYQHTSKEILLASFFD